MMRKGLAVLVLVAGFIARDAQAFGPEGHKMVGAIADQRLGGKPVGNKIAKLLDGLTLAEAALLPDKIKAWELQKPDHRSIILPNNPAVEEQLKEFFKVNPFRNHNPEKQPPSHHFFHYTDVPVAGNATYASGPTGRSQFDIVKMIPFCIRVLKGEEPDDNPRKITKTMAVILLAHFVGDIHQPLHVGAQYFDVKGNTIDPDEAKAIGFHTNGGNTITLILDRPSDHGRGQDSYHLHSFWDGNAVTTALELVRDDIRAERKTKTRPSAAEIARHLAASTPEKWELAKEVAVADWSEKWADETLILARQAYARLEYRSIDIDQKKKLATAVATEKMQDAGALSYYDWSGVVIRDGLHKGGWRLAALLEAVMD